MKSQKIKTCRDFCGFGVDFEYFYIDIEGF